MKIVECRIPIYVSRSIPIAFKKAASSGDLSPLCWAAEKVRVCVGLLYEGESLTF